jgi:hypothetical protein
MLDLSRLKKKEKAPRLFYCVLGIKEDIWLLLPQHRKIKIPQEPCCKEYTKQRIIECTLLIITKKFSARLGRV